MYKPMIAAAAAAVALAPLSVLASGAAHAYTGYCSARDRANGYVTLIPGSNGNLPPLCVLSGSQVPNGYVDTAGGNAEGGLNH